MTSSRHSKIATDWLTTEKTVEVKPIIGKAKNIKIENNEKNKDMIQGGHGKKVSWSEVVRIKKKVPNTILNGHTRRFC